jgi:hypothetical protein
LCQTAAQFLVCCIALVRHNWIAGSSLYRLFCMSQKCRQAPKFGWFGQESRSCGPILQFHARYADRAKQHKHRRFCISLIKQEGT